MKKELEEILAKKKAEPIRLALCRKDLLSYARYIFEEEYETPLLESWYHELLCNALMRVAEGQVTRLIINIPPAYGKCVEKDTLVTTTKGLVKIDDITIGDTLYSFDNHKCVVEMVLGKEYTQKESYKITMRSGREITASYDHPMLSSFGYKRMEDFKNGDRILALNVEIESVNEIDEDELTFVTCMIFEGTCTKNISFSNTSSLLLDTFFKSCANLNIGIKQYSSNAECDYNILGGESGTARAILEKYGISYKKSQTKRLPQSFFTMPLAQRHLFLGLMFATDGYISKKAGIIGVTLANRALIQDIQHLLQSCGIVSSVYFKKNRKSNAWILQISREYAKKLLGKVFFYDKQEAFEYILQVKSARNQTDTYPNEIIKEEKLNGYYSRKNGVRIDNSKQITRERFEKLLGIFPSLAKYEMRDFYYDEVVNVEHVGIKELVHIEVSNTHNFIANGLVSHNTEFAVRLFVSWFLGNAPKKRVIYTSYSDDLANKTPAEVKGLITSEAYKKVFPNITLGRKTADKEWYLESNGGMFSTTVGGGITGFHGNIVVIDDPMKAIEKNSKATRDLVKNFYRGSITSRLRKDDPNSAIIVIMQRLHEDDLVGYLLEEEDGIWTHINLTGIEEEPKVYEFFNFYYERGAYEPLNPHFEDEAELEQQKKVMHEDWYSQYMQDPQTVETGYVKDRDFKSVATWEISEDNKCISIDPAQSIKETSDNRAISLVGVSETEEKIDVYNVYGTWFGKWDNNEFIRQIIQIMSENPNVPVFMESSGGGILTEQYLKKEIQRVNYQLKNDGKPMLFNRINLFNPNSKISKNQKIEKSIDALRNHQIRFVVGGAGQEQVMKEYRGFHPEKDSKQDDCIETIANVVVNKFVVAKTPKKSTSPITVNKNPLVRQSHSRAWRI